MKIITALIACVSIAALSTQLQAQLSSQSAVETEFDKGVSSADQQGWLKEMSSAPNHLGSAHNKANAEMQLALFRQWGWDAHIETFEALYATPLSTQVELIAPERIRLGQQEPAISGDPSTENLANALPPYVVYQGDGDVTADVVYVNYGMPDDYLALDRMGISVKGKIVIARYGAGLRGLKPKLAQQRGAIGCIIYSDPIDDGYAKGDVYPKGGWRPEGSVQRGSVSDLPIYAGDPLTPGVGAVKGAKRIARSDVKTILKIPVLPMSYGDATQILTRLGGRVVPDEWRGGLPFAYHVGGDDKVKVHLAVKSDWKMTPVYNVIAKIDGSQHPDEWVIRGNHRDAWVFGAADPLSGQVALMSEAKAIGGLLKQGWRPKRTIVYASWDGEEAALIGSTEWAEQHAAELRNKAVLYINTDMPNRGILDVGGSQDFQHMVNQAAADVADPETGVSMLARQRAAARVAAAESGKPNDRAKAAEKGGDLPISALGSGSDYTAYLHFLGIASLHVGFSGEGETRGVYHSAYDDFQHYTTFDDPGLKSGAALSKLVGKMVLRVADADTPPMRFGDFADAVGSYIQEVEKLEQGRRDEDMRLRKMVADRAYQLAADPGKPMADPKIEPQTPFIDLTPMQNAFVRLRASADAYDAVYVAKGAGLAPAGREKLNALLRDIDQLLIDPRGLPGRSWYRNMIYAPGSFTGYGVKTLPGVREAIEERRFDDAALYAERIGKVLNDYATRLDQARSVIEAQPNHN